LSPKAKVNGTRDTLKQDFEKEPRRNPSPYRINNKRKEGSYLRGGHYQKRV